MIKTIYSLFIVISLANLYYTPGNYKDRYYLLEENNSLLYIQEKFETKPKELKKIISNPKFYVNPLKLYANDKYIFLHHGSLPGLLINTEAKKAIQLFSVSFKNKKSCIINIGGIKYKLAKINATNNKKRTKYYIENISVIPNLGKLIYKKRFEQLPLTEENINSNNKLIWQKVNTSKNIYTGLINSSLAILQEISGKYYLLLAEKNDFYLANDFQIITANYDNFFLLYNKKQVVFKRSTDLSYWKYFYYIKEKDQSTQISSIRHTDIIILSFPGNYKKPPKILSDDIYGGTTKAKEIIFRREGVGEYLYKNKKKYPPENFTFGIFESIHAAFPTNNNLISRNSPFSTPEVALVISKYFNPAKPFIYLFYLHGWYNNIRNVLSTEYLEQQLYSSELNAILIIPELATDFSSSNPGRLGQAKGFSYLVNDIEKNYLPKIIQENNLNNGTVCIIAHSGGYVALSKILQQGGVPVKTAILLDGLYGNVNLYLDWIKKTKNSNLILLYTDNGETEPLTCKLLNTLPLSTLSHKYAFIDWIINKNPRSKKLSKKIKNNKVIIINTGNTLHRNIVKKGYLSKLFFFLK